MKDRELLLLAAKAAGLEVIPGRPEFLDGLNVERDEGYQGYWDPLSHDGDAFRLMVKLKLLVDCCDDGSVEVLQDDLYFISESSADAEASTRRAIVRAAAATGEQQ